MLTGSSTLDRFLYLVHYLLYHLLEVFSTELGNSFMLVKVSLCDVAAYLLCVDACQGSNMVCDIRTVWQRVSIRQKGF